MISWTIAFLLEFTSGLLSILILFLSSDFIPEFLFAVLSCLKLFHTFYSYLGGFLFFILELTYFIRSYCYSAAEGFL